MLWANEVKLQVFDFELLSCGTFRCIKGLVLRGSKGGDKEVFIRCLGRFLENADDGTSYLGDCSRNIGLVARINDRGCVIWN